MNRCPYCGDAVVSDRSNFCASCGRQIREIPPEDVSFIAPEDERHEPMQVEMVDNLAKYEELILADLDQAIKSRDKDRIKPYITALRLFSFKLRKDLIFKRMDEEEKASTERCLSLIKDVLRQAKKVGL